MIDTPENRNEFEICIQAMFVCLGGEFSDAALLGYWIALSDMTLQQVQQACYSAMRTSRFIPKPAELREAVFGKTEDRATLAWCDVQKAIPLGIYKHIDFDDKLINATVRNLGGWPTFIGRMTDAEAEKWVRLDFLKCYSHLASSGVTGEMCEHLPGLAEVQVIRGSVCAPVPYRIACATSDAPRIRGELESRVRMRELVESIQ